MNPAALEIRHADTDTAADANQKGKPRFLVKVMRIDSRIHEGGRVNAMDHSLRVSEFCDASWSKTLPNHFEERGISYFAGWVFGIHEDT